MTIHEKSIVSSAETIVSIFETHVRLQADKAAFIFVSRAGELKLMYRELQSFALDCLSYFSTNGFSRKKAIVFFNHGFDFIRAFVGCLYANIIPIPINLPHSSKTLDRFENIIDNSNADFIFTSEKVAQTILFKGRILNERNSDEVVFIERIPNRDQTRADGLSVYPNLQSTAFIQYTSGSTGSPKGVIITHENIIVNQRMIKSGFGHDRNTVGVNWLPLYHDMGLIGNLLQPLYLGITCVHLSPIDFVQKPIRWLKLISDYGATTSGGPNYGYEQCVNKIKEKDCEGLDLSTWKLAYCGSEPIKGKTLSNFFDKFKDFGFQKEAFYPCYGMAEATLIVSGPTQGKGYESINIDIEALKQKNAVVVADKELEKVNHLPVVSCGRALGATEIVVVDPETKQALENGIVGELWVRGKSISPGYANSEMETGECFHSKIKDENDNRADFYRTGDLGFFYDKAIYIVGRRRELIVIRGKNIFAQDVEETVQNAAAGLRPNGIVAFGCDVNQEEKLVVLQEIEKGKTIESDAVVELIEAAVSRDFGVVPYDILFLKSSALPKTSSGKLRRLYAKELYLSQGFNNSLYQVNNIGSLK